MIGKLDGKQTVQNLVAAVTLEALETQATAG